MPHKLKHESYQKGMQAENFSKFWLRLKGYRILAHRFKTPVGEIDLIARHRSTIIAIEVKARPSLQQSLECITIHQRRRIKRAFLWYIGQNIKQSGYDFRFDVMLVCPRRWQHIKNAWKINE